MSQWQLRKRNGLTAIWHLFFVASYMICYFSPQVHIWLICLVYSEFVYQTASKMSCQRGKLSYSDKYAIHVHLYIENKRSDIPCDKLKDIVTIFIWTFSLSTCQLDWHQVCKLLLRHVFFCHGSRFCFAQRKNRVITGKELQHAEESYVAVSFYFQKFISSACQKATE
jgi:hypothetical protein